jgi:thiosulfate/3-mercaptopyruvate sulfurtransferase
MTSALRAAHFVTAAELAKLLTEPRPPVVLDVRNSNDVPDGRPDYRAGHIPGAVYVDLPTELQGVREGFSGARPLPPIDRLQARARAWGIRQGDPVVVYDDVFGTKAGRAWFVLRWAGIASARILDGGYRAWVDGGYPVSAAEPAPAPGDVLLSAGHLDVLTADDAAALAGRGALYDARSRAQFAGSADQPRSGHIPGAIAAPTGENLTADGFLKDEEELRERFTALGIDGSRPVGAARSRPVRGAGRLALAVSHDRRVPRRRPVRTRGVGARPRHGRIR